MNLPGGGALRRELPGLAAGEPGSRSDRLAESGLSPPNRLRAGNPRASGPPAFAEARRPTPWPLRIRCRWWSPSR